MAVPRNREHDAAVAGVRHHDGVVAGQETSDRRPGERPGSGRSSALAAGSASWRTESVKAPVALIDDSGPELRTLRRSRVPSGDAVDEAVRAFRQAGDRDVVEQRGALLGGGVRPC